MSEQVIILLVLFQIKHYLADYIFQTEYMLQKFKPGWDFIPPLAAHCAVHACFTLLIVAVFSPHLALLLALFDFIVHFAMDRIKASPRMLGRFNPQQAAFWNSLGLDQMVHHFTHYAIIYIVVTN